VSASLVAPTQDARTVSPSPTAAQAILETRDVWLSYDARRDGAARAALRGLDVVVRPGERIALVGPNGAGKSTLLRVVSGLLRPTRGEALLDGTPIHTLTRAEVARRIAVVPQQVSLPFAMRVDELVTLGRIPHEDPLRGLRPRDRVAVARAIERVGVGALAHRDVRELSLGERQLALLATALAQETPLLLLDEPTVHLDLRHQVAAMELLATLPDAEGTTILAVLHDLHLAAHFFPRIVVLDAGRVVADGRPPQVLTARLVRDVFGVDPDVVRLHVGG
jgi:ABC-type cobalamin/Fe3+-siderophores transport system ATPase subunit